MATVTSFPLTTRNIGLPDSTTDNAVARYSGETVSFQNSGVTINDDDTVSVPGEVRIETPEGAPLTGNLGPSGLDWIPFNYTTAANYSRAVRSTPDTQQPMFIANASIVNTEGSGFFGPASPDVAHLFCVQKDDYLTSLVEGETDTIISIAYNGRKGDTGSYIGDAVKVRSGTADDTGGVLGYELTASIVDTSGVVKFNMHTLSPFISSTEDPVSGGKGYGSFNEARVGAQYSAFHASVLQDTGDTAGFENLLTGNSSRDAEDIYFRIVGDMTSGSLQKGDILQGVVGSHKILRTESGTWKIRNTADNATLLSVADAGLVAMGSLAVNTTAAVASSVVTLHAASNQNIVLFGSVNGGPDLEAINDAGNALYPFTITGSSIYLRPGGSNRAAFYGTGGAVFGSTLPTDPGSDNLAVAGSYYAGTNKVVGARKTGWTVPTGTSQKTGYATYTAPTISNPPTQTEVQNLADAMQNVSRTLMALIVDLDATAGHGLIGS